MRDKLNIQRRNVPCLAICNREFQAASRQEDRQLETHFQKAIMAMAGKYNSVNEKNELSDCRDFFKLLYQSLTNNGTKGATNAPNLATVEAVPTPPLRITVGNISAVCT